MQNSQAVKKVYGPQKGYGEKRYEIQGAWQPRNGCDGRLMVKVLIMTIQVNFVGFHIFFDLSLFEGRTLCYSLAVLD